MIRHYADGGTSEGLVASLATGVFYGALDMVEWTLTHPFAALLYVAVLSIAWRVAFRD